MRFGGLLRRLIEAAGAVSSVVMGSSDSSATSPAMSSAEASSASFHDSTLSGDSKASLPGDDGSDLDGDAIATRLFVCRYVEEEKKRMMSRM
jgi:hypothetical protein